MHETLSRFNLLAAKRDKEEMKVKVEDGGKPEEEEKLAAKLSEADLIKAESSKHFDMQALEFAVRKCLSP